MGRPCNHTTELEPGQPYEKGSCRFCWLYYNNESYKNKWDNTTGEQTVTPSAKFRFTGDRKCNCPDKQKLLPQDSSN